jgi:hypothetical protein
MVLWAAWILAFGYAFVHFAVTEPSGDGFVRGANRVLGFLGWQGIAGMIAIAIWGVGRAWPTGHPARRLSLVPIAIALMLVSGLLGLIAWARL